MQTIVEQLRLIFADPRVALEHFDEEPVRSARGLLLAKHAPLLLLFPLFSFAAPLRWFSGDDFKLIRDGFAPLVFAGGILALAMVFDKIIENAGGPELHPAQKPPRNLALFLHLPVSAACVFFLVHEYFGFLMVLVSGGYATGISIVAAARGRGMSPARAIAHYISALVFLLIPVLLLVFALNLLRTYGIVKYLYL